MSKYSKSLPESVCSDVDVYVVLRLFEVHDPGIQHAVKKLLFAGQRGHKSREQDLKEALQSIHRTMQLDRAWQAGEVES